jgi:hypothetical protein
VKSGLTYRSNNDSAFKAVVLNLRAVNPEVATKWLEGVCQSMYVHQADECGTRPKVENSIASTTISEPKQNSVIHLIECIGILNRHTQGYVSQANFWHAYMLLNNYVAESCVRS